MEQTQMVQMLCEELNLAQDDVYETDGFFDFGVLDEVASIDRPDLSYSPWDPVVPASLSHEGADIFSRIRAGDMLVHHPYESFDATVEAFIEQAAADPQVLCIKQTLYRTSGDSPFIPNLIRAAESGKQVAVLVPTTVLAEQHERTFAARFKAYPFRVESLSRFKTTGEARKVLDQVAAGQVDVLIGTHRILSEDMRFKDLGLVVIDEEQRFGVEHKQRLLRFRTTSDVLTLSATPIPRTLHMAMLGLRVALRISEHPALYDAKSRTVLMGDAWILQPLGGSDVVAWFLPSTMLPLVLPSSSHRHIVYVGILLPLLLGWAVWRQPSARRPATVALLGGILALGPALFVWGEPLTDAILPGTLLWVAGATNLYRLAGLVPVMGLLAVGLALSARCSGRWAALALLGVGLEWSMGAPLPLRLASVPDPAGSVEAWLRDHPRAGAVLDLPFDREGTKARGSHPQRTFYLASVHGRPVASGLYRQATMETRQPGLGAFSRSVRVAWQKLRIPAGETRRKRKVVVPPPPRGALATDLSAVLLEEGFSFLTLDLALLVESQHDGARAWATEWLGPPEIESSDGLRMAWSLKALELKPVSPDRNTRGRPPTPVDGQPPQ